MSQMHKSRVRGRTRVSLCSDREGDPFLPPREAARPLQAKHQPESATLQGFSRGGLHVPQPQRAPLPWPLLLHGGTSGGLLARICPAPGSFTLWVRRSPSACSPTDLSSCCFPGSLRGEGHYG